MSQRFCEERALKIGDVYLIKFCGKDSEQNGLRPGLILQNNTGNQHSPNVIVLPLTSSIKKTNQPTHVYLDAEKTGLLRDSVVLCENPECVSKTRLGRYLTTLPDEYMQQVAVASLLATSVISFIVNPEVLLLAWQRASSLNSK